MNYNNLKIPEKQKENFKFFLNLPDIVRNEFIQAIQNAPVGLSSSLLFDYIEENVKNLSSERISALLSIYENLSDAKEDLGYNDDEFIQDLTNALLDTMDSELNPTNEALSIFRNLFNSEININTSRKIHNELLENEKNYVYSKVLSDIRPVFDKEQLIGSTIINNLKISYSENNEDKNVFFSLDEHDLIDLIEILKKAVEQNLYLKENFNNLKIIDISR